MGISQYIPHITLKSLSNITLLYTLYNPITVVSRLSARDSEDAKDKDLIGVVEIVPGQFVELPSSVEENYELWESYH